MDTTEKTLPIYELIYNEDDDLEGLFEISLVDEPAILDKFRLFNNNKTNKSFNFQISNEEQHVITGPALISGMRIYREDEEFGQYYCYFSEQTIKKLVLNYFQKGKINSFNIMHSQKEKISDDQAYIFESWFVGENMDKSRELGYNIPKGSWMLSLKITDDKLWDELKSGTLQGFSVEVVSDAIFHFTKDRIKLCPITKEMVSISKLRKAIIESDLEKFVSELGNITVEKWQKQCVCKYCRELNTLGYCLTGVLPEFGQWEKIIQNNLKIIQKIITYI